MLNEAITGETRPAIEMHILERNSDIRCVSLLRKEKNVIYVGAFDDSDVIRMLDFTSKTVKEPLTVELGFPRRDRDSVVNLIDDVYDYQGGKRYFWTDKTASDVPVPPNALFKELTESDACLFDRIEYQDGTGGWPGFAGYLREGLRYFGVLVDGRLVSTCGLCRTSVSTNEIIAVGTIDNVDRRRGYAAHCCAHTLEIGLQESGNCTWTSDRDNAGSYKTAEKIGMRLAFEVIRYRMVQ